MSTIILCCLSVSVLNAIFKKICKNAHIAQATVSPCLLAGSAKPQWRACREQMQEGRGTVHSCLCPYSILNRDIHEMPFNYSSYSYSPIILACTYKLNMISVVLKDLKSLSQLSIQEETFLDKSHLLQMTLDMTYILSELNLLISYGDPPRT